MTGVNEVKFLGVFTNVGTDGKVYYKITLFSGGKSIEFNTTKNVFDYCSSFDGWTDVMCEWTFGSFSGRATVNVTRIQLKK